MTKENETAKWCFRLGVMNGRKEACGGARLRHMPLHQFLFEMQSEHSPDNATHRTSGVSTGDSDRQARTGGGKSLLLIAQS